MPNWLKTRFNDLKYFYWIARNWRYLKGDKSSLIIFLIYWILYPIPRLLFGRKRAHRILPTIISILKNKNFIIPLPIDKTNIYWIGIRDVIDFDVFREVCIEDHYNKSLLKPEMTIVDIGAHIGTFTLSARKIIGERGRIIAIEPEIMNFRQLKRNLKLNKINNCLIINVALADHTGEEPFFLHKDSSGHSLIPGDSINKTQIKVKTLDDLLKELNISKVDFLKIDTEGVELEVLKGGKETLCKNPKMKIVIDYSPGQETEIISYLKELNFFPKIFWGLIWI